MTARLSFDCENRAVLDRPCNLTGSALDAPPTYPPLATAARIHGVVELQIQITREGQVQDVAVISGHPLLYEAAIQAGRQWRYKPHRINGPAVPLSTTVTVKFTLP